MLKRVKIKKDFTYAAIIKEAIFSYPESMATTKMIFAYMTAKHSTLFMESNSMTWKSNVRQLLSKSPEFIKIRREVRSSTFRNFWIYKSVQTLHRDEKRLSEYLQIDDDNFCTSHHKYNYIFNFKQKYQENEENE